MLRKDLKIGLTIGFALIVIAIFWFGMINPVRLNPKKVQTDLSFINAQNNESAKPHNSNIAIETSSDSNNVEPESDKLHEQAPQPDNEELVAPKAPQAPSQTRYHLVVPGESLSSISEKYYGKSGNWEVILDANKSVLTDPHKLRPGMRLLIPEL